ncbi:MAG: hypothetical protein WC378_00340 [Opitutaceae bacterium]|jgi:hypothetical protein
MENHKPRNYIPNDGYTMPGFVEARPGLNEEVRFSYRPMTAVQQAGFNAGLANLVDTPRNPANFLKRSEVLFSRLVSWDVVDRNGDPVALDLDAVRHLSPEVFWKMYGIVSGTIPTDIDPNWSAETVAEEGGLANQAIDENRLVGDVRDETNRKN